MSLPKVQLMKFGGMPVTDHNRSALSVDPDRIGSSQRMANGTMRRYYVADKKKFTCSWDDLPGTDARTVDKFWGANNIENHFLTTPNEFTLTLTYNDGHTENYTVLWDNFSKSLKKRGVDDLYSVEMSLVEV